MHKSNSKQFCYKIKLGFKVNLAMLVTKIKVFLSFTHRRAIIN